MVIFSISKYDYITILQIVLCVAAILFIILTVIVIIENLRSIYVSKFNLALECFLVLLIICVLIMTIHQFKKDINGVEDTTTQEQTETKRDHSVAVSSQFEIGRLQKGSAI